MVEARQSASLRRGAATAGRSRILRTFANVSLLVVPMAERSDAGAPPQRRDQLRGSPPETPGSEPIYPAVSAPGTVGAAETQSRPSAGLARLRGPGNRTGRPSARRRPPAYGVRELAEAIRPDSRLPLGCWMVLDRAALIDRSRKARSRPLTIRHCCGAPGSRRMTSSRATTHGVFSRRRLTQGAFEIELTVFAQARSP